MLYFHGKRVWLGDFVVMPNHVHVVVLPFPGVRLEEWLYSVKRFSAARILKEAASLTKAQARAGHLWQTESFDRVVRDDRELARIREYIAANPRHLRSGEFTLHRADWPA
jgi:putative transposase